MQVWSNSIHLFRRYCVGKPNLISFHGLVTLKMRSRSPKSIQLFPPPNRVSMQVWSKSIHWFKRYRVGKKLRGRGRRRDPHQKQYVPHLRLGGHNSTYQVLWKSSHRFWKRRFLKGFYHIWAWQPSWLCDQNPVNKLSFPLSMEAPHKIST